MRSAALVGLAVGIAIVSPLSAQTITTGALHGRITDKASGEPLPGVTVTVGAHVAITESDGMYKITDVVPGTYDVVLEFDTTSATRTGVVINANAVTTLHQALSIGEAIHITGTPPPIRTTSTAKETVVDRTQLESQPVPGTTIGAAIGSTPGSQGDGVGVALSGSSGLETAGSSTASTSPG